MGAIETLACTRMVVFKRSRTEMGHYYLRRNEFIEATQCAYLICAVVGVSLSTIST